MSSSISRSRSPEVDATCSWLNISRSIPSSAPVPTTTPIHPCARAEAGASRGKGEWGGGVWVWRRAVSHDLLYVLAGVQDKSETQARRRWRRARLRLAVLRKKAREQARPHTSKPQQGSADASEAHTTHRPRSQQSMAGSRAPARASVAGYKGDTNESKASSAHA